MILFKSLLLYFSILCFTSKENNRFTVIDRQSRKPIPFAIVQTYYSGISDGFYCNMDGTFEIKNHDVFDRCRISYIGYKSIVFKITDLNKSTIEIEPVSYELKEVIINGSDLIMESK